MNDVKVRIITLQICVAMKLNYLVNTTNDLDIDEHTHSHTHTHTHTHTPTHLTCMRVSACVCVCVRPPPGPQRAPLSHGAPGPEPTLGEPPD